ncbi:peptidase S8/S53 domain-containing protein [Mycena albidolilacea]|uniref:Peptidase S8/S53 domain-containing protein n=1 Tax=Mycena albidolilacea TaxID=1033008 RepID=A0AAD7E7L1_9AGAR|nr:peptidase S8/S53 domain-containing protein [Mycena albidolilacea]
MSSEVASGPLLILKLTISSVGATGGITETAASFSSGGFSNYFAVPSYQTADVSKYLATLGTTNSGRFNPTWRGFPDIAAQGENFEITLRRDELQYPDVRVHWCIPSTRCPDRFRHVFLVALLNDGLVAAGKAPLGFLNPFLYSAAGRATLNDIRTGKPIFFTLGTVSTTRAVTPSAGFSATTGWDPVTGLGTPNFALLKAAVGL